MYPEPYKRKGFPYFYFVFNDPASGRRKIRSTGQTKVGAAKRYVIAFMDRVTPGSACSFAEYAMRFFDYETNPRAVRYRLLGKCYGRTYCLILKSCISRHVLPDRFSLKAMAEITRGDIVDLQARLARTLSPYTVNKTISYVKSIFSEAFFRGDIQNNPAAMVSKIKTKPKDKGIFTPAEIRELFSSPDKWDTPLAYHVFKFAAYTGRRSGEILALQWEQLRDGFCTIDRSYHKMEREIGAPKWNIEVVFPMARKVLEDLPEKTGNFVFINGKERIFETWWNRTFRRNMEKMGIDYKGRNLTPHSFRHSLNTNLLLAGVPDLYVRKYIGWTASSRDTQAAYTHIRPEDLRMVADAIDRIY